jgi:hypothetical protein
LAAVEKKKKKDADKKWSRHKMVARDALVKCRRAQAREGLPLEASPSMKNDDDDDEGMEVQLGFNPKVELWSGPTSAGPSGGIDDVSVQGPTASVFVPWVSAEVAPVPAVVEEARTKGEQTVALPQAAAMEPMEE